MNFVCILFFKWILCLRSTSPCESKFWTILKPKWGVNRKIMFWSFCTQQKNTTEMSHPPWMIAPLSWKLIKYVDMLVWLYSRRWSINKWYLNIRRLLFQHLVSPSDRSFSFLSFFFFFFSFRRFSSCKEKCLVVSGVATWDKNGLVIFVSGSHGGGDQMRAECTPLTAKNLPKIRKKREKIREKMGKRGKNREKVLSLCPSWQIGLATLLLVVYFMHSIGQTGHSVKVIIEQVWTYQRKI